MPHHEQIPSQIPAPESQIPEREFPWGTKVAYSPRHGHPRIGIITGFEYNPYDDLNQGPTQWHYNIYCLFPPNTTETYMFAEDEIIPLEEYEDGIVATSI